jgi:hypothetical protein
MNQTVKRFRCTATEVVDAAAAHPWRERPPAGLPLDPAIRAA